MARFNGGSFTPPVGVDVNTDPMAGFTQNPSLGNFDMVLDSSVADSGSDGISQPRSLEEMINKIKSTDIYKTVYSVFLDLLILLIGLVNCSPFLMAFLCLMILFGSLELVTELR